MKSCDDNEPMKRVEQKQARGSPWQEKDNECLVCLDRFLMTSMISCTNFLADILPLPTHAFCHDSIRGQAQAANDEIPLAQGGVGLKCMAQACENPILYSDIRMLLGQDARKKLDERIMEENIGMASIQKLERCKICNFGVEMEDDKHVSKVFNCLNSGAKFCRFCERQWDEEHIGITCAELDTNLNKNKRERELEKQLNEAVIRKCPRCGLGFMKDSGCNKLTCRCGMTHCYICRQSDINYDHFCMHPRDPNVKNWKCSQCTKTCIISQDANEIDSKLVEEIRKHQEREKAGEVRRIMSSTHFWR